MTNLYSAAAPSCAPVSVDLVGPSRAGPSRAGPSRLGSAKGPVPANAKAPKGTHSRRATPHVQSIDGYPKADSWSDANGTLAGSASGHASFDGDVDFPSSLLPGHRRLYTPSALHNSSAECDPTTSLTRSRNINKRHGHDHRNGFVNYDTLVNRAIRELAVDGGEEAHEQPPLEIERRLAELRAAGEPSSHDDFSDATDAIDEADNNDLSKDDGAGYWVGCRPLQDENYDVNDASESARREAHRAATLRLLEGFPYDLGAATTSSQTDNERIGGGANTHHQPGGSRLRSLLARLRRFIVRHARREHTHRRD